MKVLVICNNGNSSSIMAQKMTKQAKLEGVDIRTDSAAPFDVEDIIKNYDVVLIAPQIKHDLKKYQGMHDKVELIPPLVFGMTDGKKGNALATEVFNR